MNERVTPRTQTKAEIEGEIETNRQAHKQALTEYAMGLVAQVSADMVEPVALICVLSTALACVIGNMVKPDLIGEMLPDMFKEIERSARTTLNARVNMNRSMGLTDDGQERT